MEARRAETRNPAFGIQGARLATARPAQPDAHIDPYELVIILSFNPEYTASLTFPRVFPATKLKEVWQANQTSAPMIITEKTFTYPQLRTLCEGHSAALVVKQYANPDLCNTLAEKVRTAVRTQQGSNSAIYQTDSVPFFNAIASTEKYKTYFSTSLSYMRHLRELCAPFLGPTDKLRLELDELWPFGAGVMDLGGQKMVFGIARIWAPGSQGLPHQDVLRRELPDEPKAKLVARQFGVNIYLTTPTAGGEVEIWDRVIDDSEWKEMNVPGSYGFSRSILPQTSTLIKPEAGDLVFIDTCHVHAIRPVTNTERITISGFMAYFNDEKPLELWS